MAIDSGFVEDIEYPDHSALERALTEACENTATRLRDMGFVSPEDWLVRKAAFAYFYDWKQDKPDYAFVLPDPGNLGKKNVSEVKELKSIGPEITPRKQVKIYRSMAKKWLIDHKTDFPQKFFPTIDKNGFIEFNRDLKSYVSNGRFFDNFYMTDVVKYRVSGYDSDQERASFHHQLKQELTFIDPNIIFVFGGSAWDTIQEYLSVTPVNPPVGDESSITKIHGELYYTDSRTTSFVVPLGHMSGNYWWQFPPEDYIERLDATLNQLREVATEDLEVPDDLSQPNADQSEEQTALDSIAEDIGEVNEFGDR